jgi:DNA-binding HxlR family transcriptional regulator
MSQTEKLLKNAMPLQADVLSQNCPSRQVLKTLTSRWGLFVMIALQDETLRFSALRRRIGGVSERMLAQTLQTLEHDGFVHRKAFDVVPPHVEYRLTPLGQEAAQKVLALSDWIEANMQRIDAGRGGKDVDAA